AVANAKTTMRCWHNAVRRKKKKQAAGKGSEGAGGVAGPPDVICQGQQQVASDTWLTTRSVPLLWLHLLLLVAFAKQAAAATTATNPEATATTLDNYTTTTTAAGATSSTATTSLTSAVGGVKSPGNWDILEDPFKNFVRIGDGNTVTRTAIEQSLVTIHDIATENLGTLCISTLFRPLQVPINSERFESSRQKADLAASILQEVGIIRHGGLSDALAKGLLTDDFITGARILALNLTNGVVQSYVWWVKGGQAETQRYDEDSLQIGKKPAGSYPWFDDESSSPTLRSPKFAPSPPNNYYKGWWTFPYFSCSLSRWLVSYSIAIPPIGRHGLRGFISIDIDVSTLRVNQCEAEPYQFGSRRQKMQQLQQQHRLTARRSPFLGGRMGVLDEGTINDLQAFHSSHKCHRTSMVCDYRQPSAEAPSISGGKLLTTLSGSSSWARGSYQCLCRAGYYSLRHPDGFNGTIMEIAWQEQQDNISNYYTDVFKCLACAPGCDTCTGPEPCLANYHWPFRISLLTISIGCACGTFVLAGYLFRHRRVKVFKVASPIFLMITLIGCAIMYLEKRNMSKKSLKEQNGHSKDKDSEEENEEDLHEAIKEMVKTPDIDESPGTSRRRSEWQDRPEEDHCHFKKSQHTGVDKPARRKLIIACILCFVFMIVEIVGGVVSNSLAIATDAAHLLTDLASFLISLFALYLAGRPSSERLNFGWYRAEVIGAMISVFFIWVITGILVYMAIMRWVNQEFDLEAKIMLITSALAILFNIIMAVHLSHGHSHFTPGKFKRSEAIESQQVKEADLGSQKGLILMGRSVSAQFPVKVEQNINVRAALIHVIGDLIQSIGVFVAALIIYFEPKWAFMDSVCTFVFSVLVLVVTFKILKDVLMVLMEATPDYMDYEEVKRTFLSIPGVEHVHNLRIWALSINKIALSAHLAISKDADPQLILEEATTLIHKRYRFFESTIQIEEFSPDMKNCEQCSRPSVKTEDRRPSDLEEGMVAIFPYLDTTWCIATKWTRHMGFCITYTSLLMKTWRVSLTYRVKSAHKIKLNDQQLLQWMVPILLVMLIYLGTWTISATPNAEVILDQSRLKFKQCSYNWWDHSLAIGEVFFLAWGIRVCYNVRNAESLYNEARLISYAIYNIALVNIAMVVFHKATIHGNSASWARSTRSSMAKVTPLLLTHPQSGLTASLLTTSDLVMLFPNAGPDYKYMLGFVRTQLSTTTTIALVFGPKILRVLKGQGDKWDQKAKVRSITASFSLNGVGLVPEESPDLYQENEELKEQVQKLAHQIEFMKTVHMQMNNRHLKPKPGGYFTITSTSFQAPYSKNTVSTAQTQTGKDETRQGTTTVLEDAIEFDFHQAEPEEMITLKGEQPGSEEAALIAQFRRLFAPILDDSLNLYYQLNDLDDAEHVRIHQTVAQMHELTSSEEETMVTQVNSPSPPVEVELLLPLSSNTSTASSSLFAIHTPSPAHPSGLLLIPQNLESPMLSCSDAITITEQVQLHNPPYHLQVLEDENNTSCSLSSNLTDSKTLDGRTPIVV
ncbi:hypothetical protein M5D96_003789, partial [Drosophila gunungcola]